MPWDSRGYYYRKKRSGSRVVSEYVGRGWLATLTANADAQDAQERELERRQTAEARAQYDALDQEIAEADQFISDVMKQTLEAAGYHQHDRGEWRKRREQNN